MTITAAEFDAIRRFVRDEAGIVLHEGKEYLVETRMAGVLRSEGLQSLRELVARLESGSTSVSDRVVDALTTNETSFFRDGTPFEVLRQQILPDLIEHNRSSRRLRIWCAASSSGQEPVSLAIVIREHFPELLAWDIRILATDLCTVMLKRCRTGIYSSHEVSRGLSDELRDTYFDRDGSKWRVSQAIQRMIEYQQLNLTKTFPKMVPQDLISIRNVLIYFDETMKKRILRQIHENLRPSGYLMLGTAEVARSDVFRPLDSECASFYRPV